MSITKRRKNAKHALESYLDCKGENYDTLEADSQIIDLIADLLHLADGEELHVDYILRCANMHFECEKTARKANAHKHGRCIKGCTH